MDDSNRRQFLRATAGLGAVAAVGGTAGCLDSVPLVGGSAAIDAVPVDADAVVYADLDTVREDEGVRTLTDTYLEQQAQADYYDGPEDFEELLDDIEEDAEIDPANVHEATAFWAFDGDEDDLFATDYLGIIVRADLSVEDIRDSLEALYDAEFDEDEHSGRVVYEPEGEAGDHVGALSSGAVVGTEDAVHDAIDVETGDAAAVDGDLRGAYTATRDAPVRFASRMPSPSETDAIPETETSDDGETYDLTVFDDVATLAGSVYRDGAIRGLTTTLAASDADAAADVADLLDDLQGDIEDDIDDEAIAELVGDIDISQDGSDVTTSLEREISELASLIEDAYEESAGSPPTVPQVSFAFDYESPSSAGGDFGGALVDGSDTGRVTVTHEAGDTIDAATLTLTDGNGNVTPDFASAAGLSEVVAGTSVSARIDTDDELRVVYTSGDTSATLATYEAPGA